jgi:hypothetical protein
MQHILEIRLAPSFPLLCLRHHVLTHIFLIKKPAPLRLPTVEPRQWNERGSFNLFSMSQIGRG